MKKIWRKYSARRGLALVLSLVFLLVFSTLSLTLFSASGSNLQMAANHVQANRAQMAADSGLEFVKSWMNTVHIVGNITPQGRFSALRHSLAVDITNAGITDVIENQKLWIGSQYGIILNQNQDRFSAVLESIDLNRARVTVTGSSGVIQRRLSADFTYGVRQDSVFNFGVATKGPLNLNGNIGILGATMAVEADVYIESEFTPNALSIIGNSQIAGDVKITNPQAVVTLQGGQAGIGGETGQAAIQNHVDTGVNPTQFPYPYSVSFKHYTNGGDVIDSTTNLQHSRTFVNARILPNTNPVFNNNVAFQGILYVESPNVVTFGGSVDITGMIVAEGSWTDNSGVNKMIFQGNVASHPVTDLPNVSQFAQIRNETGTFIMAPGYSLSFGGNFGTVNGAIAGNGIQFYGNSGGTIAGSVINYSPTPMNLSGNSDLIFNRSGITDIPSGFLSEIVMYFDPTSYSETVVSQ